MLSLGASFERRYGCMSNARAFVVYADNIVECDVRFENYEGPCRVLKSAAPAYVHADEEVSSFRWAVTLDHARHIAVSHVEAQLAEHVDMVKQMEDTHKRVGLDWSARDLADAKAGHARVKEKLRFVRSVSPHEGPTMHRFERKL
jgi:hypothetical protein